jgi:hypothetical protein
MMFQIIFKEKETDGCFKRRTELRKENDGDRGHWNNPILDGDLQHLVPSRLPVSRSKGHERATASDLIIACVLARTSFCSRPRRMFRAPHEMKPGD